MEALINQSRVLIRPSKLELRRAVVATLLRSDEPMRVREIVRRLGTDEGVDVAWIDEVWGDASKVVNDALRYQMMLGRVRRVRWGTYGAVPAMLSVSMRFRCLRWQQIRRGEVRGR